MVVQVVHFHWKVSSTQSFKKLPLEGAALGRLHRLHHPSPHRLSHLPYRAALGQRDKLCKHGGRPVVGLHHLLQHRVRRHHSGHLGREARCLLLHCLRHDRLQPSQWHCWCRSRPTGLKSVRIESSCQSEMLQAQEMKRMKHHNKRRQPAAMLIQCLWRLEVGRRDGTKELLNIQNAQANGKSTSNSENGVTQNGRLENQSQRILGAMYSLRKLKYLACRSHKDFTLLKPKVMMKTPK